MRHTILATSFTFVAVVSSGCLMDGAEPIDEMRTEDAREVDSYQPVLGAKDGHLAGALGALSGLDHEATQLSTYDDGYYISLETVVAMPDRAAMTLFSVSDGAAIFRPGLHATFRLEDNDDGMRVTMLGCVGQEVDVYDEYDAPADEVDVTVTEGETDGEIDVALQGRWYGRAPTGERTDTFTSADTRLTLLR